MTLPECCTEIAERGSVNSDLEHEVLGVLEVLLAALRGDFKTTDKYWIIMRQNVELAGPDGRYDKSAQRIVAPDLSKD